MTNVFGSTKYNSYANNLWSRKEFDTQIIRLTKRLDTKLNKNENLDMNNHNIVNVADPKEYNHGVTKQYCDSKISETGKILVGDLDLQWHTLSSVQFPDRDFDAVNKFYVQFLLFQKDKIDCVKLVLIASGLKATIEHFPDNEIILKFGRGFQLCFDLALAIQAKYSDIFSEKDKNKMLQELSENCVVFPELKVHIVNLVNILPLNIFLQFKKYLIDRGLLSTPDENTVDKRFRRLINKTSKEMRLDRNDSVIELSIQKNLLLLDLGFTYLNDTLLRNLFN